MGKGGQKPTATTQQQQQQRLWLASSPPGKEWLRGQGVGLRVKCLGHT